MSKGQCRQMMQMLQSFMGKGNGKGKGKGWPDADKGKGKGKGWVRQQGGETCREWGSMFPMLGDESPPTRMLLSLRTSDLRGVQQAGTCGPCMHQQSAESDEMCM